jgi:hypothetical protein
LANKVTNLLIQCSGKGAFFVPKSSLPAVSECSAIHRHKASPPRLLVVNFGNSFLFPATTFSVYNYAKIYGATKSICFINFLIPTISEDISFRALLLIFSLLPADL